MRLAAAFAAAGLSGAVLSGAAAQAASPAVGLWSTPQRGGRVEVSDCAPGICGRIAGGADITTNPDVRDIKNADAALRTRKLMGTPIFEHLTGGPPKWTGKVYNPVDGKTYSGSVTLTDADTLKLTGCVFVPLCQTQVWHRLK